MYILPITCPCTHDYFTTNTTTATPMKTFAGPLTNNYTGNLVDGSKILHRCFSWCKQIT